MANDKSISSLPVFSGAEESILELYDTVRELQLQLSLLKARQQHTRDEATPVESQKHLLDAKVTLSMRNNVVEGVLTATPTLKAVHHATHASPVERDLLPYIEQRDKISNSIARMNSDLQGTRESLASVEIERLRASMQNVDLASETLRLANATRGSNPTDVGDEQLKRNLDSLENQVKTSRQRWRVMKGTASAIVAGSGIDWIRDERLRALVLDTTD
ncbi:centromere protein H (CENP-H)-domain-containing protein [Podospora fimiseda]|uniref:Centromere protein H (CENP-H)-domain-containing protein n=1 Tax=Podospora fimiseda TaxID=252190 RepID=A0AAN7BJT4_9PEZI|nr:centromere protein H (CENP-H)-domain-containing protein [Podospora fimiseda]